MRHLLHSLVRSLLFVVMAGVGVMAAAGANAAPPSAEAALADRILGDVNAPVTMVDFSSLTCPHCAVFHTDILPKIKEKYIDTGKVRLVFRDFPLDRTAVHASALARCGDPKRFYGFLDVLFKSQAKWSHAPDPEKALAQIGALGGVAAADYKACLDDKALTDGLLQRMMEAQKTFSVQSTPTFVFNDGADKIEGAQPFEKFEAVIDQLLAR